MPLSTPPQSLLSTLYALLLPTIFLNPVLFLHSLNTILTRLLPSLDGHEGNSAQPHLDIHASESLCWSYTFLIVWAQMAAFLRLEGRLGKGKVEGEEGKRGQGECEREHRREDSGYG